MSLLKKEVVFELSRGELLNSNAMPNHYIVKSKIASNLRNMAADIGVLEHIDPIKAQERLNAINHEAEIATAKARTRKRMNKKGESEEAIKEELDKIDLLHHEVKSSEIKCPFLFEKFKVVVTVCPPSKRRFDPPNLYPTIKHLIDGFTDSSWWEDDQYTNLLEMSFRYGGLSGSKDKFKIILNFEEVTENDINQYIINPELMTEE